MRLEFHLALSSLQNGDFEAGDFIGWTQRNSTIDSDDPHSGNYCSVIEASGANANGAISDAILVNPNDLYSMIGWNKVNSLDKGDYKSNVFYFSDIAGSNTIGNNALVSYDAIMDWTKVEKTFSNSGAGADFILPGSAQSIRVQHSFFNTTTNDPQGLGRMDDVIFGNLVQLYPEYDYKGGEIQLRNQMRTPSGKGYLYKHGDYDKFQFTVNYLSSPDAAIVNSWWNTNAKLLFLITSSDITEVHSVILMNKDTPFQQFNKPYADKYKGKVLLEGY